MYWFYGGAMQGSTDRAYRAQVHGRYIDRIKREGKKVIYEHARGQTREESLRILEAAMGPLPADQSEREAHISQKILEALESHDLEGAVFEYSEPSLGTGFETSHVLGRLGKPEVPVLGVYQNGGTQPRDLSIMIKGIRKTRTPNFTLKSFETLEEGEEIIADFVKQH